LVPTYLLDIDHVQPIIPISTSFEDMSLDEVVDRTWCPEKELQALCESCHDQKTKVENAERRRIKKERKGETK
jgi:5-methylcytosine-specific restriction endonuclease McrA